MNVQNPLAALLTLTSASVTSIQRVVARIAVVPPPGLAFLFPGLDVSTAQRRFDEKWTARARASADAGAGVHRATESSFSRASTSRGTDKARTSFAVTALVPASHAFSQRLSSNYAELVLRRGKPLSKPDVGMAEHGTRDLQNDSEAALFRNAFPSTSIPAYHASECSDYVLTFDALMERNELQDIVRFTITRLIIKNDTKRAPHKVRHIRVQMNFKGLILKSTWISLRDTETPDEFRLTFELPVHYTDTLFDTVSVLIVERFPRLYIRRTVSAFALPLRNLATVGTSGYRTFDLPTASKGDPFAGRDYALPSFVLSSSEEGTHVSSSVGNIDMRVEFEHVELESGRLHKRLSGLFNPRHEMSTNEDTLSPSDAAPLRTLLTHWILGARSQALPTFVSLLRFIGHRIRQSPLLVFNRVLPARFVSLTAGFKSSSDTRESHILETGPFGWKPDTTVSGRDAQRAEISPPTPRFSADVLSQFDSSEIYRGHGGNNHRKRAVTPPSQNSLIVSDNVSRQRAMMVVARERIVSSFTSPAFVKGFQEFDSLFVSWMGVPITGPRWLRAWTLLKSIDSPKATVPMMPEGVDDHAIDALETEKADHAFIKKALRYLDYAYVVYGSSIDGWQGSLRQFFSTARDRATAEKFLGFDREPSRGEILFWRGDEDVFEPVWLAAIDKQRQTLVLAVRGTWNVRGLLTDVAGGYAPFGEAGIDNGVAHK
ncbi:hypothetical protein HDU93_009007, partial [Gonapodya sp. JEL0774]